MHIPKVWLMAVCCLLARPVLADDIHLVGFEVPQLLPLEEDGPYTRILDALAHRMKPQAFSFARHPVRRAVRDMTSDKPKADCIFPTDIRNMADMGLDADDFLQSDPLNFARVHIFTAPGSPRIKQLNQLDHLAVAYTAGYGFGPVLTPAIEGKQDLFRQKVPVVNSVQSMRMLLKYNRVDAVIGYLPEDVMVAQALDLPRPNFDANAVFFEVAERIVCHKNPRNEAFLKGVNDALAEKRHSGELKRVLGAAYLEPLSESFMN